MIVFKCKNCNGEMSIDRSGALYCEYCGSKAHFSDAQLEEYKAFRGQMLNYLRNMNDIQSGSPMLDLIWGRAETVSFVDESGTDITVRYIYTSSEGDITMYVARNAVLYHFNKGNARAAQHMEEWLGKLEFPPADIKGLGRCFPKLTGRFSLNDGGMLLSFAREETVFPLSIYGALNYKDVAWVVSRIENICCVLEYNSMQHGGINLDSVFINPVTHEAILYGGWWKCGAKPSFAMTNKDLCDMREAAKKSLGYNVSEVPALMMSFLKKPTRADAYDDFAAWDEVIEKGMGGHHFHKMNVEDGLKI